MALVALPSQDQVAVLDTASEVGNGDAGSAVTTPNIAQQALADLSGDGLPSLEGLRCETGRSSNL